MYLHTNDTPKSAPIFIGRLREIEKIAIRGASEGALEHMRQTNFASDNITPEVMAEVKATLDAEFASHADDMTFGATWKI